MIQKQVNTFHTPYFINYNHVTSG